MNSPAISGDALAGKPAAYAGKHLHVAVNREYTVWTNDGNEPIARCIDLPTAHLLAAGPDLVEALQALLYACDSPELISKAQLAIKKAGL